MKTSINTIKVVLSILILVVMFSTSYSHAGDLIKTGNIFVQLWENDNSKNQEPGNTDGTQNTNQKQQDNKDIDKNGYGDKSGNENVNPQDNVYPDGYH